MPRKYLGTALGMVVTAMGMAVGMFVLGWVVAVIVITLLVH